MTTTDLETITATVHSTRTCSLSTDFTSVATNERLEFSEKSDRWTFIEVMTMTSDSKSTTEVSSTTTVLTSNSPFMDTTQTIDEIEISKVEPVHQTFYCHFTTTLCFQNTDIILTNGTELPLLDISEPPRAPLSDATSVNRPTINNYKCNLPYQLSIENSTNTTDWNIWFCYNNQCPTDIDPSESNKTISTSISPTGVMRSLNGEHCIRYYFYLTVYDVIDWDQQISI
ncbi:hypothetical protein I4U23_001248 [Adineta vaga]|nr:hypothetical protein I4U23_001248 [Adineta vaga]